MKPLKKKTIILMPYDPYWPTIFKREKAKILTIIGKEILAIEHIGSTAVPGLAAKPVIDTMVAIKSFTLINNLIDPLKTIGYQYIPEDEMSVPISDEYFFHRGPSNLPNRHFHLHVVAMGGKVWSNQLLFRDYLRRYKTMAKKYENLKKKLAIACQGDISFYVKGKSKFIRNIIKLAKREGGQSKK